MKVKDELRRREYQLTEKELEIERIKKEKEERELCDKEPVREGKHMDSTTSMISND